MRRSVVGVVLATLMTHPAVLRAQPAPQPPLDPPPAPAPQNWQPAGNADLRALNKVNAAATTLNLHVGQTVQFGTLSITLRACFVRPADEAADSAGYLEVRDSHPGEPGFDGWMLAAEPELNMLEHPVYGLRLVRCR